MRLGLPELLAPDSKYSDLGSGMQGFPDYFALVGLAKLGKSWVRNNSLTDR